jgi:PAS domain S-box-containing protein
MNMKMTKTELIKELQAAHERIEKQESYFRALIANAKDVVVVVDRWGKIAFCSLASESILGYPSDELIGRDFRETIHPEDMPMANDAFASRRQTPGTAPESIKVRARHQNGEWRVVEALGTNLFDDPMVQGLILNIRDVTEQERAFTSLRENQERFRSLFENSPATIMEEDFSKVKIYLDKLREKGIVDLGSYLAAHPEVIEECLRLITLVDVNQAGLQLYGVEKKSDLLGGLDKAVSSQEYELFKDELIAVFLKKTAIRYESLLVSPQGEVRNIIVHWAVEPGFEHDYSKVLVSLHDITERKQMEQALRESERRLNQAQDMAKIGDWEMDVLTGMMTFSDTMRRLFDLDPSIDSIHVEEVLTHFVPGSAEETRRYIQRAIQTGEGWDHDVQVRLPNARVAWQHGIGIARKDEKGGVVKLYGVTQDITERKQAEEALQQSESHFATIFENSPVAHVISRLHDKKIVYANTAFLNMIGHSLNQVIGQTTTELGIWKNPADRETFLEMLIASKQIHGFDAVFNNRSGEELNVILSGELVDINNEPCLLAQIVDITARKKAEVALRSSERVLRLFVEHSPAAIAMLDREMRYIVASRRYNQDYELGAQNLIGRSHYEVFPDIPDRWKRIHERCLNGFVERAEEDPFLRENGRLDWVHWEIHPWYEDDGKVGGLIIFSEVITERKLALERLRESEDRYHRFVSQSFEGIMRTELDEPVDISLPVEEQVERIYENAYLAETNPAMAEIQHMPFDWMVGSKLKDIDDGQFDKDGYLASLRKLIASGYKSFNEEMFKRAADGRPVWVLRNLVGTVENGRLLRLWETAIDITDRVLAEIALIESEERYRTLINSTSNGVFVSQNDKFVFCNDALPAMLGYFADEFVDMPFEKVIAPEYLELWTSGFKRRIQGEDLASTSQIQLLDKTGSSRIWVELRTNRFMYNGHPAVLGIVSDITEKIEAERRINESETRFRQIADSIQEVFWMFDYNQKQMIYVSPAFESIWGRSVRSLYEDNGIFITSIHPDDQKRKFAALEEQSHGNRTEIEYRVINPDGSTRWVQDRSFPVFDDETGKLIRTAGIAADITERRAADQALQDSEERLRLSLSAGHQGFFDFNIQTGNSIVNREYAEMLGYDPESFVENFQNWFNRLHPDDKDPVLKAYNDYLGGVIPEYRVEFRQRMKDGNWKWILSIGKVVEYDADEKPLRFLGTHTDIDRLKQAEFEIQKRATQMSLLNDIGQKIAGVLEIQGILDLSARLLQETFGYHHVALFILDADKGEMVMRTRAGKYTSHFPEEHRIKLGEGIVGMAGSSGEMMLTNQVDKSQYYINFFPERLDTLSELGLPIKVANEVVGVLDVQSPLPNAFSPDDIQVLQTLVNQVAIAIENARLYESVKKELAERKLAEKERQKLIHSLGERVKELMILHQAARLLQNLDTSEEEILLSLVELLPSGWQYPEIAVARIIVGGQVYASRGFTETEWMQSTIFDLPNDKMGRIEVAYLEERPAEDEGPFILEERNLLETLAERLSSALQRQSMERDLRRRAGELTLLLEAGRALTETLDPQRIYPVVYRYISAVMPCDFLILSSYDADTELITCTYLHSGEGPQDVSNFPPISLEPPGRGTQSRVIRNGDSLLLSDYETAEIVTSVEGVERTRSAIIVPLRVHGLVAGTLQVFSMQVNAHTQDHLRFVEALAFHVSAALSNARLFSELEERVKQRTAEVQDLYDNAPTGYHSLDAHGNIVTINQTELDWIGYTREEVIGRPFVDFITEESRQVFAKNFPVFKQRGWINDLEFEMRRKNGLAFPVLINATAIRDIDGNYLQSRSTVFDNTERNNTELALRESEQTYRALFESANDAIFMLDIESVILQVNQRGFDLLGTSPKGIIGRKITEFIAPSEVEEVLYLTDLLLAGARLPVYERKLIRNDGILIDAEINLSLVPDVDGTPKFIQSVIRDITERKQAEKALRESEEQNRLLFEESPEAVVLFDQLGRVVRVNHAFEIITGIPGSRFVGHTFVETGLMSDVQMVELMDTAVRSIREGGDFVSLDSKLKNAQGELLDINARVFTLNLQEKPHYLVSMHDETTNKRAEETLRFANAEMERSLRLKDEFLANMSHELRTPLNAILGMTESLLEQIAGPLNPKQKKYLNTVLESAQHLLELINDILDLAKVNAGRIDLDINKTDIASVAHSSLRMIRELAQKKGLNVQLTLDPAVHLAWVDERRLKQMLVNLLSNAVKFTPQGGQIGLDIRGDLANQVLQFTVWDTGVGIRQEDLHLLFRPFVQLDAGLARGTQGTGLGLVLVSQMARLHGGGVSVASELDKGTRFTISIPWSQAGGTGALNLEAPTSASDEAHSASEEKAKTILIVEDTESVTMLIRDYLERHGYRVFTAKDGFEGLKMAGEKNPDLILMDVMMPEMDGLETTRRIRNELGLNQIIIIALTALAMTGNRERCLAAGMNDYLSKPVRLKELLTVIEQHLHKEDSQ